MLQTAPNMKLPPGQEGPATIAEQIALVEMPSPVNAASSPKLDASKAQSAINPMHHVKAKLTVCMGTVVMTVGELMAAKQDQVFRLNSAIDEPVDLLLEGHVIARGQLVAIDNHFALRISEIPRPLAV